MDLLDPSLATWNLETLPGTLTENLRNSWGLYLESLLGALEPSETLLKNLCWEPRPSLGTFQNLYSYLDGTYMLYLEPRNLPEPLLGTLARNLGTFWNPLWLEPLLGTSEPAGTFTWNPYTWNLGTFLLGTLTWNLGTCRNLYLEPLYLEPRNLRNLTWNPYLEPRNLPEPLLGTLTRNLGTCRNLYLEPLLGTSEPAGTFTWNPLLGTLTWNLGTCRNLYLEPLLGTSEPARTWRDDCPRVPQGLVWLGPQSFQLLGKNYLQNHHTKKENFSFFPLPKSPAGHVRWPPPAVPLDAKSARLLRPPRRLRLVPGRNWEGRSGSFDVFFFFFRGLWVDFVFFFGGGFWLFWFHYNFLEGF